MAQNRRFKGLYLGKISADRAISSGNAPSCGVHIELDRCYVFGVVRSSCGILRGRFLAQTIDYGSEPKNQGRVVKNEARGDVSRIFIALDMPPKSIDEFALSRFIIIFWNSLFDSGENISAHFWTHGNSSYSRMRPARSALTFKRFPHESPSI